MALSFWITKSNNKLNGFDRISFIANLLCGLGAKKLFEVNHNARILGNICLWTT
jgi:hypothetical protein